MHEKCQKSYQWIMCAFCAVLYVNEWLRHQCVLVTNQGNIVSVNLQVSSNVMASNSLHYKSEQHFPYLRQARQYTFPLSQPQLNGRLPFAFILSVAYCSSLLPVSPPLSTHVDVTCMYAGGHRNVNQALLETPTK